MQCRRGYCLGWYWGLDYELASRNRLAHRRVPHILPEIEVQRCPDAEASAVYLR